MKKIAILSFLILCAAPFVGRPAGGRHSQDAPAAAPASGHHQRGLGRPGPPERDSDRRRQPQPPARGICQRLFRAAFILGKLKEYGITDARIIDLPTRGPLTWDAEMGELWIVKPNLRKIADLKEVAASLCSGSVDHGRDRPSSSTSAPATRTGITRARTSRARSSWSTARRAAPSASPSKNIGALGVIAYSSSHPEFDPDEVGWSSVSSAENMKKTFGFMVSTRQGNDLRDQLERGAKIEVRAVAKTQMVPYKEQMVEAVIKGQDYPEEELVFTAHLFEGFAKQGANDNISGCVLDPRDGARPAQAHGRRQDPAAQAVGPVPVRPRNLRDVGLSADVSRHRETVLRQHQPGHGRRGPRSRTRASSSSSRRRDRSRPTSTTSSGPFTNGSGRPSATTARRSLPSDLVADRVARPVLLRHRPLQRRQRPRRLRRQRPAFRRSCSSSGPTMWYHTSGDTRGQIRLHAVQARRGHRRRVGHRPRRGRAGRGRTHYPGSRDAVLRAAGPGQGQSDQHDHARPTRPGSPTSTRTPSTSSTRRSCGRKRSLVRSGSSSAATPGSKTCSPPRSNRSMTCGSLRTRSWRRFTAPAASKTGSNRCGPH